MLLNIPLRQKCEADDSKHWDELNQTKVDIWKAVARFNRDNVCLTGNKTPIRGHMLTLYAEHGH